ncbi:hypothetical protein Pryu01_02062 [Paraliobacillus ryukyuensis]|uniref:Uncharacterized protein n=1 Tax=Paraliobacillus ryukyuensis TaxID=200904 RepID=A0A366E546_9BACI|nr:hypothetical protein [Paraliobacillus ryukyuensis]RBO97205.1 hypothetical protein DES48_107124 [Paraliobacillus ryukyuensis]
MELKVIHSVELPFILNLPNDVYNTAVNFRGRNYYLDLQISNTKYKVKTTYQGKDAYFEVEEDEIPALVEEERDNYREKLRTHISWEVKKIFNVSNELEDISQETKVNKLQSIILYNEIDYGDNLVEFSKSMYSLFNDEEKVELGYSVLIERQLSVLSNPDLFLSGINRLIKAYSVLRDDFFVEKCTLHTLRGIQVTQFVDSVQWQGFKRIGKLPPIINKPWLPDITQQKLTELKNILQNGVEVDPLKSLTIVAKNLLEKGETRSAIINISAVLEYSVERKIRTSLFSKGKTEESINKILNATKMNFKDRCNKTLKRATGKSLVIDYPTEWYTVDTFRKKYRHSIAHSVLEPTYTDTENMIKEFEKVIAIVESL